MKLRLVALALAAFSTVAAAHADDTFRRTLDTSAQPDVYLSNGAGSLRIMQSNDSSVEVVGHVHAGWKSFSDIEARVHRIVANPPIKQSGNSIRIGEVTERSLLNNITIDYEIRVPHDTALNLHTGSGDIEINSVGRFVAASAGSGSIRAREIHGPAELQSGSGDIEINETVAAPIKARSGSGSIRITGLNGSLNARTGSGDIEASGHLDGPSEASTGSGSVRLHTGDSSHFNLEAATGSGTIRVHFPGFEGHDNENRHHVTAPVNGGGAPLAIRTGSGDVEITR
ncbi:MAG: DUF4097 family beta strand repeat-containing protein [Acidobacteriaceae bacterium]|nr:DUF4097 family beta strand repeat-containing protein [Acidobacteriaceae bacterium]